MTTAITSAVPHTRAEDTNQGARRAVCHISCPCCRPKIQAVTECTSTAVTSAITETMRSATALTLPRSAWICAHRYTHDRMR